MSSTSTSSFVLGEHALDTLFLEGRTANTFTDDPVSPDQIRDVFDLVKFGPTSMNMHPMRLLLVEPGAGRERLLPHMADGNRDKTGRAPLVAVVATDTDFHELMPTHFPAAPDAFADDPDARTRQARFNGAIQVGYFILGIRAAGLAAGPMLGFDAGGVDAEFFSDSSWRSQVVVNIGYPGEGAWGERLPRIDTEDAVQVI